MAEEKKPKIDLKTRLQKMGAGANVPPAAASSTQAVPLARGSVPAPMLTPVPPAVPPPPGLPTPHPPALDPNNPLHALSKPFNPSAAPAPPPAQIAPQKIEVDEGTVQQARSGTRNKMLLVTAGVALLLGGIGFGVGGVMEKGKEYDRSKVDISALKGDVTKAKAELEKLSQKLVDGKKKLAPKAPPAPAKAPPAKFPDDLAKELSAIDVDFDGAKLAGKRFSGMKTQTSAQLVDFITGIEAMKTQKRNFVARLNALQKPLTEELAAREKDTKPPINLAVVIDISENASNRDAQLAPFAKAFLESKETPKLPEKLKLKKADSEVEVPYWASGKVPDKTTQVAIPVSPNTFDKVCPNPNKGQYGKVVGNLNALKDAIQADEQPEDGALREEKLDLVQRATRLIDALEKDAKGG